MFIIPIGAGLFFLLMIAIELHKISERLASLVHNTGGIGKELGDLEPAKMTAEFYLPEEQFRRLILAIHGLKN